MLILKEKNKRVKKSVFNTFEDTHCLLNKPNTWALCSRSSALLLPTSCPFCELSTQPRASVFLPQMPHPFPDLGRCACQSLFLTCSLVFPISFPCRPNSPSLSSSKGLPFEFHQHMMSRTFLSTWLILQLSQCYIVLLSFDNMHSQVFQTPSYF